MTNWEWPQYLLAAWWTTGISIGVWCMLIPSLKMNYQKFAMRIIDVTVLVLVLYMGGFWS